ESATAAQGEAADRFRQVHHRVAGAHRIEPIERGRVDVDPIQHALDERPHRSFAEARPRIENTAKWGGRFAHSSSRSAAATICIVQEKDSPGASRRAPVSAWPRSARLNASVICVTGSIARNVWCGGM